MSGAKCWNRPSSFFPFRGFASRCLAVPNKSLETNGALTDDTTDRVELDVISPYIHIHDGARGNASRCRVFTSEMVSMMSEHLPKTKMGKLCVCVCEGNRKRKGLFLYYVHCVKQSVL